MIGICTRYRKTDATFAALSIARHMDDVGRRCSIVGYDSRNGSVDPAFDNRLVKNSFQSWYRGMKHIVWTAPVDGYFLDLARKRGIKNTLYTGWDQIEPYDEQVLNMYSHVLTPTLVQAMQIRDRLKIKNVAVLPFDCYQPITKREGTVVPDTIRLFMSLYGQQLRRIDLAAVLLLAELIKDHSNVEATIACSKGLAPYTIRDLTKFSKRFGSRWTVLWDSPWYEQAIQMGKHDITVWPAKWDGFGIPGLTSLHMGTPVFSWDITPVNEHVMSGRNAILVACDVEYDWLGVPHVVPNYTEFDRVLRWLVKEPDALRELRKYTHENLETKVEEFHKGLETILPAN